MALKNKTCYAETNSDKHASLSKLEKSILYCCKNNLSCGGFCHNLFNTLGLKYSAGLEHISESNTIQHSKFIGSSLDWSEKGCFQEKINIFGYGEMKVDLSVFKDSINIAVESEHVKTYTRCCSKFKIELIIDIGRRIPTSIIVTDDHGFLGKIGKTIRDTTLSEFYSNFFPFLSVNSSGKVKKLQELLGKYMMNFYNEDMEQDIEFNTILELLHFSNGYYLGMKFQDIGYEESEILKAIKESGVSIQRVYTSDYDDCYTLIEQVKINIEERVATGELHKIN